MREQAPGEQWWWAVGGLATTIGVVSKVAPRRVTAVFGLPAAHLTGAADLGWRLFGVRTAVVGAGVLAGVPAARSVVVPVQLLDQVVFAHAAQTGGVPPPALPCSRRSPRPG